MSVRDFPIGYYGAVMGLAGLGLSARAAAPLFPGVVRAPAYFTEPWVALGVLAFLILTPAYLAKLVRFPAAAKDEFTDAAQLGFCGALPVGLSLVAGGLAPYAALLGSVLWWTALVLLIAFQAWAVLRWLAGKVELPALNAGWLILMAGGIVVPGPGISLGHVEASRFAFGFSATFAAVLFPLLLYRAAVPPELPERLRASWFILLVPPSCIYANGIALYPDAGLLEVLYPFGLVLGAALLVYARRLHRWPFGPAWWALTFPLEVLAYAAARYAQDHPAPVWKTFAALTLALATAAVVIVLWRTLRSAASRRA